MVTDISEKVLTALHRSKNRSVARKHATRRLNDYLLFHVPLKTFFSYVTIAGEGPLSKEESLLCHTCCDTNHPKYELLQEHRIKTINGSRKIPNYQLNLKS
jgi:hypothetical protein